MQRIRPRSIWAAMAGLTAFLWPAWGLTQSRSTLIDGEFGKNRLVIHMSPEARRDAEAGLDAQLPEPARVDRNFVDELRNWQTGSTTSQTVAPAGVFVDPPGGDVLQAFADLADLNGKPTMSFSEKRRYKAATAKATQFLNQNAEARRQHDLAARTRYEQLKGHFRGDTDFTFDDARRVIQFNGSAQLLDLKKVGATANTAAGLGLLNDLANTYFDRVVGSQSVSTRFQTIQTAFGDSLWQRDFPQMLDRAFNQAIYHDYRRFDQMKVAESLANRLVNLPNPPDDPARIPRTLLAAVDSVSEGLILAEDHSKPETRKILTDSMADLRTQGVDTIYLENFSIEIQPAIDQYLSPGGTMSPQLEKTLTQIETNDPTRSLRGLLDAAKSHGLRIRCLNDPMAERFDLRIAADADKLVSRAARQNFLAAERVRFDPERKGKYVVVVGEAHAQTHPGGIPGLSQLLYTPAVKIDPTGSSPLEVLRENTAHRELSDLVKRPLRALPSKLSPRSPRNLLSPDEFVESFRQRLLTLDTPAAQRALALEFQELPDARKNLAPLSELAERVSDPTAARLLLAAAPDVPGLTRGPDSVWRGDSDRLKSMAAGLNRLHLLDRVQQVHDLLAMKTGLPVTGSLDGLHSFLSSEMPSDAALQQRFLSQLQTDLATLGPEPLNRLAFELQTISPRTELRKLAQKTLGGSNESRTIPPLNELIHDDGEVARRAWLKALPDLNTAQFGLGVEDIGDLTRIQKLIVDAPRMMDMLEPLNRSIQEMVELNRRLKGNLTPAEERSISVKALGAYLSRKEAEHGLSQTRVLPLGVLPGDVFLKLPALGYVAKDPGAGIAHGEFTHRLQWYAIMESFDRELARAGGLTPDEKRLNWRKTPYELYTGIGKRDMLAHAEGLETMPQWQRPLSAWSLLMDQQGAAPNEGFRHPDTMEATLSGITDNSASAEGELPALRHLSMAVRERHEKRMGKVRQLRDEYLRLDTAVKREAFFRSRGIDPATVNLNSVFETIAASDYSLKKINSQDYELFDPEQPRQKLLVRKGQPRAIEAHTELIAWHLRERVFELPLLPEQAARKAAPRIEEARLKAQLESRLAERPAPRQPASKPAVEHQYDEIPAELRRRSQRLSASEFGDHTSTRFSPRIRPPHKAIAPQYQDVPAELRARDSLRPRSEAGDSDAQASSSSTSMASSSGNEIDEIRPGDRPLSESWPRDPVESELIAAVREDVANRIALPETRAKNQRAVTLKPNQKNVYSSRPSNTRRQTESPNRHNFPARTRPRSSSHPPNRKPNIPPRK